MAFKFATNDPVLAAQIEARSEAARLDAIAAATRNVLHYAEDEETEASLKRMAGSFIDAYEQQLAALTGAQTDVHLKLDDQTVEYVSKSMIRGLAFSAENGMKWTTDKLGKALDDLAALRRQGATNEITANRMERVSEFIVQLENQIVLWTLQRDAAAHVYHINFGEQLQLAGKIDRKQQTAANSTADRLLSRHKRLIDQRAERPAAPEGDEHSGERQTA